jgi:hypothetical protein
MIRHGGKISLPETMHPAQHLPGTKRLFTVFGKKGRQAGGIEIEQIDRHLKACPD